jgi:hypothetical protein
MRGTPVRGGCGRLPRLFGEIMAFRDQEPLHEKIERIQDEQVRAILRAGVNKKQQMYDTYTPRAVEILCDKWLDLECRKGEQ